MEGEWDNSPDELQRARDKIQSALNEAKERYVFTFFLLQSKGGIILKLAVPLT